MHFPSGTSIFGAVLHLLAQICSQKKCGSVSVPTNAAYNRSSWASLQAQIRKHTIAMPHICASNPSPYGRTLGKCKLTHYQREYLRQSRYMSSKYKINEDENQSSWNCSLYLLNLKLTEFILKTKPFI